MCVTPARFAHAGLNRDALKNHVVRIGSEVFAAGGANARLSGCVCRVKAGNHHDDQAV
jgi:hypothetical protein